MQPGPEPDAPEAFDLDSLPPVPETPRALGPNAAMAAGLLLTGLGAAMGLALYLDAAPFDGLAAKASSIGLTPGLCLVGGAVATLVGWATAGLASLERRVIDTLDLASDPMPLLERIEHRLVRAESRLEVHDARMAHEMRVVTGPLAERLGALEARVAQPVEGPRSDAADPSGDAIWRLAASMDQVRAQIDRRLQEQLSAIEAKFEVARPASASAPEPASKLERQSPALPTDPRPASEAGAPSGSMGPAFMGRSPQASLSDPADLYGVASPREPQTDDGRIEFGQN